MSSFYARNKKKAIKMKEKDFTEHEHENFKNSELGEIYKEFADKPSQTFHTKTKVSVHKESGDMASFNDYEMRNQGLGEDDDDNPGQSIETKIRKLNLRAPYLPRPGQIPEEILPALKKYREEQAEIGQWMTKHDELLNSTPANPETLPEYASGYVPPDDASPGEGDGQQSGDAPFPLGVKA